MKSVDILMVVDVDGALAAGYLQSNIYLIDTNKHVGFYNGGGSELYTKCMDGETIRWRVTGVSPGSEVEIQNFGGQMVEHGIALPQNVGTAHDAFWEAMVKTQGQTGQWQYSANLTIGGRSMAFELLLIVGKDLATTVPPAAGEAIP
ncbi:MAG: hypothetical protein AAGJ28_06895 [Pseudomonadota bacterium]